MTDSGTKVPPSLDCSELTTARNFQQHHHPDRHSVDDIAHKIRQIPFSPGDEYLRCPSTHFCFPQHPWLFKKRIMNTDGLLFMLHELAGYFEFHKSNASFRFTALLPGP